MGIRIPQNQIVKSKYTIGKEYMFELTHREYQGYYYELNNKMYAGKEFNTNAPILVKIIPENINTLLTKASTYVYGRVSKTKLSQSKIVSSVFSPTEADYQKSSTNRYFIKKLNSNPILIKEINEELYNQIQKDPLYISIIIKWNVTGDNTDVLKEAEKKIPGISIFLQDSLNFTPKPDGYSKGD
jgi:cell division protein FtsI/penicillin-binding protein 2